LLTRRGWGLALSSLAFLVAGRLFGLVELFVLAAVSAVLCIAAVAYVYFRSVDVEVTRTLHPPRVFAGMSSRVELDLYNRSARRTPVLTVRDPFDGGARWARFLSAPLGPRARTRAAYRLPTERRGIYDVGPMHVGVADPFGLAGARFQAAGVTQLTVYPHIDVVHALPSTQGHDPHSGTQNPTALVGPGEDFYALRPYEMGDDTRRVHWPSTARVDDLMIRQDEMPWQTRSTILLDVRAEVHTEASLDIAVSAAASIHDATRRQRALLRVVTTAGSDSGYAAGHAPDQAILERRAAVATPRSNRLAGVAASLRQAGNGGSLAIVTTADASDADFDALAGLRGRYSLIVLVLVDRSAYTRSAYVKRLPDRPVPTFSGVARITAEQAFPAAWARAITPVGSRR